MKALKILRWPIASVCLMGLVTLALLSINPHWMRIEQVQIDIDKTSKEELLFERIRQALAPKFKELEGRYFWEVPLNEIFEVTSKDKRVKQVSIFREFPSRLRLVIEPHTPVLMYLGGDGRVYPVATDATLLPAINVSDAPDLPFLRGQELKDQVALREAALELFEQIPLEGSLRKKVVSEIVHSKKDGFKVFISGTQAELKIGDSDFAPKISRVQKVLAYLDSRNIKGRIIDARFSKKVVVRVRNP